MQADNNGSAVKDNSKRPVSDWRARVLHGGRVGVTDTPAWLGSSYETLRTHVLHPEYPCFFGTIAERRGEMFYAYVEDEDSGNLVSAMSAFTRLAAQPEYRRHNLAVFFKPDRVPLSHRAYHDRFWRALQQLHDLDPDPQAHLQPEPSDEAWEFGFGGLQMFVVCACPSFARRHSRNLGPGMVLLFQPRAVFVDTITNKVIGREARNQVRERLRKWDDVDPHPDLGFYGDPGNLEWKQYFLEDENLPASDRCPFLRRQQRAQTWRPVSDGQDTAHAAKGDTRPLARAASGPSDDDAD
ncbi:YqcI/YcgG family protein [Caballeronia sp. LZ035]|uniref:YqcI/YcgG family protein n=1 Tax=Caballeronia sp. LZ035 TaxID=3038568 RepID=UPI002864D9D5|nr:YqcI/YcgG family protein [Caballeronia sp. LZ035]MDR5760641.1 YqcI/YcgG family protein [Caballeronia sp. LZ035]